MPPDSEKSLMKISELEERTGIPRETIHYYIREGLLPAPMKKGLRLAYYDERYVGLIDLIKKLQEERYLPLSVIRNLFREQKYEVGELERAFVSDLFGKSTSLRKFGLEKLLDELKATPLPKDYLAELCRCGLLSPEAAAEPSEPNELDLKLAQLCLRGEKLGFHIEQLKAMTALIEQIVELERTSLTEMLRHKEGPKEFVAALKDRQAFTEEFLLYQRARLIQEAVQRFIHEAQSTRIAGSEDVVATPSEAFRRRYKIDEQIAVLEERALKGKDEKACNALAWVLFFSGRHASLFALDDRRRSDRFKLAVAYANAMRDQLEPAVKWCERAIKRHMEDPFFLALAGGLYMLFAARTEGFIEPTIWISKGLDLVEESLKFKSADPFDALCVDFLRARIYLALPAPFGRSGEGRRSMEQLLDRLQGKARQRLEPSFTGEIEIFEVSIHYFLAEAARVAGEKKKAAEHYRRVLELDPACDFGAKAFIALGELE